MTTVLLVPGIVPNVTAVAPVNPVPVTVTSVSPAVDPFFGEIPVTFGGAPYVNRSAVERALVPPGVATFTFTIPAVWAGEVTLILVLENTVMVVPALAPKVTAVAPENPAPVMVTSVLPDVAPFVGEMLVTVGFAAR